MSRNRHRAGRHRPSEHRYGSAEKSGAAAVAVREPAPTRHDPATLNQVYVDKTNVDDWLVGDPAPLLDPGAFGVFGTVFDIPRSALDELFAELTAPLLLLWGIRDPGSTPPIAAPPSAPCS